MPDVENLEGAVQDLTVSVGQLSDELSSSDINFNLEIPELEPYIAPNPVSYSQTHNAPVYSSTATTKEQRAAEQLRKARVKNYQSAIDEKEHFDEQFRKTQKERGLLSLKDEQDSLTQQGARYRQYADDVLTVSYMTEQEKLQLRNKYLEDAENAETNAFKVYQKREQEVIKLKKEALELEKARAVTFANARDKNSFDWTYNVSSLNEWEDDDSPLLARERVKKNLQSDIDSGIKSQEEADKVLAKYDKMLFETRLQNSYDWIEQQKNLGLLSYKQEVDSYKRIEDYLQEYYEAGIIDRKQYYQVLNSLELKHFTASKKEGERLIKAEYKLLSDSLDKKRKLIEDNYRKENEHDSTREREKELNELLRLEELYADASEAEGQQKLKEIRDDILKIKQDEEKDKRDKQYLLDLQEIEEERASLILKESEDIQRMCENLAKNGELMVEISAKTDGIIENLHSSIQQTSNVIRELIDGFSIKKIVESAANIAASTLQGTSLNSAGTQNVYNLNQTNNNTIPDRPTAEIVTELLGEYWTADGKRLVF